MRRTLLFLMMLFSLHIFAGAASVNVQTEDVTDVKLENVCMGIPDFIGPFGCCYP